MLTVANVKEINGYFVCNSVQKYSASRDYPITGFKVFTKVNGDKADVADLVFSITLFGVITDCKDPLKITEYLHAVLIYTMRG